MPPHEDTQSYGHTSCCCCCSSEFLHETGMYVCPWIAVGNVISSVIYHVTCSFNSSLGEVTVAVLVTDGLEFEPVLGGS